VRGLHRFAARDGLVADDVARGVTPPALPLRLPRALCIDEVDRLLAGRPGDDAVAVRDRALLELLYSTGARISEAVGIDVDDLDERARTVLLRGKGGKERLVPVGRPALAAVEAYRVRARPALAAKGRAAASGGALLLNARGARLSRQSAFHGCGRRPRPPVSSGRCRRTPCGTASPPTCSPAARTCGWCRSCSATRRWPRLSSTRTSPSTRCARSTPPPIPRALG
jgi:integrase